MKTSSSLFFLITLFLAGCTEHALTPTSKPLDTSVISPLVTGDKWIYDVSTFDSNGIQIENLLDTVEVGLSTVIQGETWYLVSHHNKNNNDDPKSSFYFANRIDGYYFFSEHNQNANLDFKYPVQSGYTKLVQWDSMAFSNPITVTGVINNVPSIIEFVRIDSNTFNCYHYQNILFTVQNNDTVKKVSFFEGYLTLE